MNIKNIYFKILTLVAFISVIVVNSLATTIPINGLTPGQISDSYPNLFAPTGLTFSIWGLIYLLLSIYTIYQLFVVSQNKVSQLVYKINSYFIINSIANICWIFSWHYRLISLSLLFMVVILFTLIKIANLTSKSKLTSQQNFLIRLPFSVYFGWITVATIANIVIWLVSINWTGFGLSPQIWTIIVLLVGSIIGILRMLKDKSVAYGMVFLWAYFGIWLKHTSALELNRQYPNIITTLTVCFVLILISTIFVSNSKKN